jgi:hypothetical protein
MFRKSLFALSFWCLVVTANLFAQQAKEGYVYSRADGTFLMSAYIDPRTGDTVLYAELREIEIKAPRFFASAADFKRWERYRYYAPTVIPFAVKAVRTYRQLEAQTRDMSNRDRKKVIKKLEDELEADLRKQMKNMTRTQGLLMMKMIERELHMSFYDLVKDVQGGFAAFYWNEFGKMYDYKLKEAYVRGQDPILDSVLDQFDLSYYLYAK